MESPLVLLSKAYCFSMLFSAVIYTTGDFSPVIEETTPIISEKENVWKAPNAAFLVRTFNGVADENVINGATPKTHLMLMRDENIVVVPYQKGLSTATETEIVSDEIQIGDKIITGRVGAKTMSSGNQMRMGNPMGGPRR